MSGRNITIVGAGILGLWQALTLARAGHRVRLVERSNFAVHATTSLYAGAMLAPYCEAEASEPALVTLGVKGLALWQQAFAGVRQMGTLVVAGPRDRTELMRFSRMTRGHHSVDAPRIAELEADFTGRFASGLFYPSEAHVVPEEAMRFLVEEARQAGAEIVFDCPWTAESTKAAAARKDIVIDCRGLAARDELGALRGVRGERIIIRSGEVGLSRPVRLLHPRHPLYVVPWGNGLYMIGATVIESEDAGPVTVRSALELLGLAYALHPGFGEAQIVDMGAGVRPSFPDNMPRAIVRGSRIFVNGAFRHGFLLAPVLAEAVAAYLADGSIDADLLRIE